MHILSYIYLADSNEDFFYYALLCKVHKVSSIYIYKKEKLEESFLKDTYLIMTLLAIEFFERNHCNPIKIRPGDHTDGYFFSSSLKTNP